MKKVLALVLAVLMVVAMFAACGNDDNAGKDATTLDVDLPVKADFEAGAEWDGTSEPTTTNGNWAQSYAVMAKLAEMAAEYADVKAEYTFKLACHDPAASAPGEFLTAWADAVTIATKGAVDFDIGYSGAHSGTMAVVDDMVAGTIDFGWTLPCYFKGYFPLTNVIQNPALGISDATVGSNAMWELYKSSEAIQAEYDEGEVLFLWTNCTSPLSYKGDHEIASVSEIVGNIRGNNGPTQDFITAAGGTVMGCPIGDVYNNISTGIFSYVVTDWHGIKSFALADPGVLNYYLDYNVGCSAYALLVNNDVWALVEQAGYADVIKAVSGDYLLEMVDIWNFWEAAGRYVAIQNGGTIFAPSAELAAELDAVAQTVAEQWIAANGENAQEVYDKAVELVEKYSK